MNKIIIIITIILVTSLNLSAADFTGFAEYGVASRISKNNYTTNKRDYLLNEIRLQLKYEHSADMGDLFFKVDFNQDNVLENNSVKIKEAYFTSTPFEWMDVKIGRQIQTWGVGDLLFINDVFQKDWISFFSGRSDEDLKAPSDAFRFTIFPDSWGVQAIDISVMPYSQPDINLQSESRFGSANPIYAFYQKQGIKINPIERLATKGNNNLLKPLKILSLFLSLISDLTNSSINSYFSIINKTYLFSIIKRSAGEGIRTLEPTKGLDSS